MDEIAYRVLDASWHPRIAALDRSETVSAEYALRDGELVADERIIQIPQWSGEWLESTLQMIGGHLDDGAILYGASAGDELVGVAEVGTRLRGSQHDTIQLCFLLVDRAYRRRGIAAQLMAQCMAAARERGARYLYISATPLSSALAFYHGQGARLAHEVDAELMALEPLDIHLEIPL
ncbi:MAG: GNAT family N-acetyltransferase [Chloroflexi bacterium]|nr:GNAT family N-acetyltransferase [Chloroflexota bacterium]